MTQSDLDLHLAELLASRLCHDLVGPISAISNGMELLEEGIGELDEEARRLVADSAGQAAQALQFFRVAFGFGAGPNDDPVQLRGLLEPFLAHRKATLDWPGPVPEGLLPAGWGKLLLNMAALAVEALPLGGRVEVAMAALSHGGRLSCLAVGADAGLRAESSEGLAPAAAVEALTPRSVQAFYAARVAARLGGTLTGEPEAADRFLLSAILPG
ncbi:MAG: histidine phosphotransferase family protein [Tistlia sp.]|uniref:histidine phosphotransferase family protein n=1 Tax=Tistlia sp. TaxID=3057121 RepID=UPI0034A41A7D